MLAAWGTFIESRMGALYAKRFLYLSPGFVFLEALLFLNVLMAMLVRLPPRKKLCGFFLAHAGVLLLLAGAGMTGIWGLDGSLTLYAHEPSQQVTTNDWDLMFRVMEDLQAPPREGKVSLPSTVREKPLGPILVDTGQTRIVLRRYLPFAKEVIEQGSVLRWESVLPERGTVDVFPAVELGVTAVAENGQDEEQVVWVSTRDITVQHIFHTAFLQALLVPRTHDLPFLVTLTDFKIMTNPGTDDPAGYESAVTVTSAEGQQNAVISMNHPLKKGRYTFYQSSYYVDEETGQFVSVLSVNDDPGRWLKYLGAIVLVVGMGMGRNVFTPAGGRRVHERGVRRKAGRGKEETCVRVDVR
ncbi:MAG: CcmF/CcyK/CcsA family cytochrome c biogenesis protein, partial [uncultured bacterium]